MGLLRKRGEPGFFVENSGFFGSLESTIDEDIALIGAYRELAARAGQLRAAYNAGRISAEEYGTTIAGLRVQSSDGRKWTIGATTGRWYVRRGDLPEGEPGSWELSAPPLEPGVLVDKDGHEIGWAAETETVETSKMVFTAYTGGDITNKPTDEKAVETSEPSQVVDMFGAYVEQVDEKQSISGILVVDELDDDDNWKQRYFDLRPITTRDNTADDDAVEEETASDRNDYSDEPEQNSSTAD